MQSPLRDGVLSQISPRHALHYHAPKRTFLADIINADNVGMATFREPKRFLDKPLLMFTKIRTGLHQGIQGFNGDPITSRIFLGAIGHSRTAVAEDFSNFISAILNSCSRLPMTHGDVCIKALYSINYSTVLALASLILIRKP
jgi:hypothetical protein